jgi:transposase
MHSFQVIRDVLQTTSAKQIASDMGLSLSLIYKWAEKPDPEAATASHNPLDRMDQLLKSTRDLRLIHWLPLCKQETLVRLLRLLRLQCLPFLHHQKFNLVKRQ